MAHPMAKRTSTLMKHRVLVAQIVRAQASLRDLRNNIAQPDQTVSRTRIAAWWESAS